MPNICPEKLCFACNRKIFWQIKAANGAKKIQKEIRETDSSQLEIPFDNRSSTGLFLQKRGSFSPVFLPGSPLHPRRWERSLRSKHQGGMGGTIHFLIFGNSIAAWSRKLLKIAGY